MALDADYGPLIDPQPRVPGGPPWKPWEQTAPASLAVLDDVSGARLSEFTNAVLENWRLGEACVRDLVILWLVDADGRIRFAWEELVVDGEPQRVPKHVRLPLMARCDKVGHPSLIDCGQARIAGELFFDETTRPPAWRLNNRSGRYGMHESRRPEHLANVSRALREKGILVEEDFFNAT